MSFNGTDKNASITLSSNKMTATKTGGSGSWCGVRGNAALPTSGKYFFCFRVEAIDTMWLGVVKSSVSLSASPASSASGAAYVFSSGGQKSDGSGSVVSYGASYSATNVISVAVDADSGKVWFAINNTWQASGDPASGTNAAYSALSGTFYIGAFFGGTTGASVTVQDNSDQAYSPPSGFTALSIAPQTDIFVGSLMAIGNTTTMAVHNTALVNVMRM